MCVVDVDVLVVFGCEYGGCVVDVVVCVGDEDGFVVG